MRPPPTRANGSPSGSTSSTTGASRSESGRLNVIGLPGSSNAVVGANAPETSSSRSSSSTGVGQCWGAGGSTGESDTRHILSKTRQLT